MPLRIGNPLSALEALAGVPRRFGDLPGDDFVLDELREAAEILGLREVLAGEGPSGLYDPETGRELRASIGAAPIAPFGQTGRFTRDAFNQYFDLPQPLYPGPTHNYLRKGGPGGGHRLGPARTKGQEMKRQFLLKNLREGRRGIESDIQGLRYLPELSPSQDAFRQFLMRRGPGEDQALGNILRDVNQIDDKLAGRALREQTLEFRNQVKALWGPRQSEALIRSGSNESISGISSTIDALRKAAKRGEADPWMIDDAVSKIDRALEDDIATLTGAVENPALGTLANRSPQELIDRAARLAAMRMQLYRRQPGRMMDYTHGTWAQRGADEMYTTSPSARAFVSEDRAAFELWDDKRKQLFKDLMKTRRSVRKNPPGSYQGRT